MNSSATFLSNLALRMNNDSVSGRLKSCAPCSLHWSTDDPAKSVPEDSALSTRATWRRYCLRSSKVGASAFPYLMVPG